MFTPILDEPLQKHSLSDELVLEGSTNIHKYLHMYVYKYTCS